MACTLSELTCLSLHRPGRHAPAAEQAAYLDRIATVHEQLAAECDGLEATTERRLAADHHSHAHALRSSPARAAHRHAGRPGQGVHQPTTRRSTPS